MISHIFGKKGAKSFTSITLRNPSVDWGSAEMYRTQGYLHTQSHTCARGLKEEVVWTLSALSPEWKEKEVTKESSLMSPTICSRAGGQGWPYYTSHRALTFHSCAIMPKWLLKCTVTPVRKVMFLMAL